MMPGIISSNCVHYQAVKVCIIVIVSVLNSCKEVQNSNCGESLIQLEDRLRNKKTAADSLKTAHEYSSKRRNSACLDVQLKLGDLFYILAHDSIALEHFHSVLKLQPQNQAAMLKISYVHFDTDKLDSSIFYLENIMKMKRREGFIVDKEEELSKYVKDYEVNSGEVAYSLGLSYYFKRDLDKALKNFSYCIQIKYKLPESYGYRGCIYLESNLESDACENLKISSSLGDERSTKLLQKYCSP
jgi:tetratricopeptide (TPR) repeat protein